MNRTKYFLASLLIVLGGMFATFSTANAQCSNCPYDANWYPNIPWNTRHDTIIYTVNNVTCTTIVNYCYRTVGLVAPFTEIFLCGAVYIVNP